MYNCSDTLIAVIHSNQRYNSLSYGSDKKIHETQSLNSSQWDLTFGYGIETGV